RCPSDAWVKRGSYCYLASCSTGDMQHARQQCASFGARLASVHDVNEELFIDWLAKSEQNINGDTCGEYKEMYIGLTTNNNGASWEWDDGSTFDYEHWVEGEPNNTFTIAHCTTIQITDNLTWQNVECTNSMGYICKKAV
ncbi:hypothetical protein CAPTEDRAFT_77831, partial [Capitella teleta]